ncbi:MAG: ABC transporter substrate-binding protein [Streptosporangiales bacterium]|nr:ABC transporter substrate-binding protein [Streptosporangiales bacterium]
MRRLRFRATAAALASAAALAAAGCGSSAGGGASGSSAITLGSPGTPPVISGLLPYIAQKEGFYKKYGVNVIIKSFSTGTDATRAVADGQIDTAIMPPAQLMELAAKGIPLVGVQGQEVPDWVTVSTDPAAATCGKLKGQAVSVDAVGGIRYTALASMVKSCGLTIKDVKPVPLPGSNAPQALIAGQVKEAVLHLNELIDVQRQLGAGKVHVVMKMSQTSPRTMYEMYGALKPNLAKKRQAFVDMVAAQIATLKWMADPANQAKVAQLGTVVGDPASVMKQAMRQYLAMGFWTLNGSGMPAANVSKMIKVQEAVGNLSPSTAPSYSKIVDQSVYADAAKHVSG